MGKGSFILYDVDLKSTEFLTDSQAGALFKALSAYRLSGTIPDFSNDTALQILFHQISEHIAINEEKYKTLSEKRSDASKKRWNANANKTMQTDANACNCIKEDANLCLYDTETVTDTDTATATDTDTDTDTVTDTATVTDTVACGGKKKPEGRKYYNKKNNVPSLLRDEPAYDIEAFTRKAIGLKYAPPPAEQEKGASP